MAGSTPAQIRSTRDILRREGNERLTLLDMNGMITYNHTMLIIIKDGGQEYPSIQQHEFFTPTADREVS